MTVWTKMDRSGGMGTGVGDTFKKDHRWPRETSAFRRIQGRRLVHRRPMERRQDRPKNDAEALRNLGRRYLLRGTPGLERSVYG